MNLIADNYEVEVSPKSLIRLLKNQMQPKYCARELVQNSRDAGASEIRFDTGIEGDDFFFSVSDNGCGMSYEEINKNYLTIMNSSKRQMEDRVGRFGVGRLSVLGYEPDSLTLETDNGAERYFIEFDKELTAKIYRNPAMKRGTQVTFKKEAKEAKKLNIEEEILDTLKANCKYVEPKISFNGRKINKKIDVPGEFRKKFKGDKYRGVLALSDDCKQQILEGGILVETGKLFDENVNLILDVQPSFGIKYPFARNCINRDESFAKLEGIVAKEADNVAEDVCKYLDKSLKGGWNMPDLNIYKLYRGMYNFLASAKNPVFWKCKFEDVKDFSSEILGGGNMLKTLGRNYEPWLATLWGGARC